MNLIGEMAKILSLSFVYLEMFCRRSVNVNYYRFSAIGFTVTVSCLGLFFRGDSSLCFCDFINGFLSVPILQLKSKIKSIK